MCLYGLILDRAPYMFFLPATLNREYNKKKKDQTGYGNFTGLAYSEFAQNVTSYLFFCLG